MRFRVHVIAGPESGRVVELGEGATIVGRSTEVAFSLAKDTGASRSHAELSVDGNDLRVRDLGSKHGTFVNGVRVPEAVLGDGDRVQVGDSVMRIEQIADPADSIGATLPSRPSDVTTRRSSAPALDATHRDARSSAPALDATHREGSEGADPRPRGAGPGDATIVPGPSGRTLVPVRCRCGATASREPMHARDLDVVYLCDRCQHELASSPVLPAGYELVRLLGRGAMGSVFLARDTRDGALRAIKQILPRAAMSAQMRALFLREASVQSRLVHPNIVRVFELVEPEPASFSIVMEYVDGVSADALIASGNVAAPELVVEIGAQALAGLAHAHAQQIVHRDIKEPNLMLVFTGTGIDVKVADFGLAKNFHESGASGMTNDGALGGTLPYMPREQLLDFRYVKPPADIYALGATMYRLLTGCYPRDYRENENAVLVSLERPIVPLRARRADLPAALCAIVERALEQDVERRWPSALAMRDALRAL